MTTSTPRYLGLEPVSQMVPPSSDLPMRRSFGCTQSANRSLKGALLSSSNSIGGDLPNKRL
jgi:hypothetical protein